MAIIKELSKIISNDLLKTLNKFDIRYKRRNNLHSVQNGMVDELRDLIRNWHKENVKWEREYNK